MSESRQPTVPRPNAPDQILFTGALVALLGAAFVVGLILMASEGEIFGSAFVSGTLWISLPLVACVPMFGVWLVRVRIYRFALKRTGWADYDLEERRQKEAYLARHFQLLNGMDKDEVSDEELSKWVGAGRS